jgi:hypothetical protein
MVTLPELRPGDTCLVGANEDVSLVVKVVDIKPEENALFYVPAFFSAVGVPEFVSADDKVCTCVFPPGQRFERLELEAGA